MPVMPDSIADAIRAMGHVFDPSVVANTFALYDPLIAAAPREGISVARDLHYGPNPRHLLDIHVPEGGVKQPMPVVVFIHGGGFVRGHKNANPENLNMAYANIANYFARNGMIGVNATYRLAPEHQWPAGAEDVGSMVAWLRDNIAEHGGDPDSIFLFGQSAGAVHAATYLFFPDLHRTPGSGVAGAALFSGVYDVESVPAPASEPYYGADKGLHRARSPIHAVANSHVPLFIVIAEYDPPMMELQGIDLLRTVARRDGHSPRFSRLKGHNHLSEALHLNTGEETVGPELLDFVRTRR
ncbi:MAG: alpha/beta hydrolase [Alphaproteobacteria bacterium]